MGYLGARETLIHGINLKGYFLEFLSFFMYDIQHCFICRPSDSTVSENAGIEPRTVATTSDALTTRLDLIHNRLDLIHTRLDLIQKTWSWKSRVRLPLKRLLNNLKLLDDITIKCNL
jgi:hypothetical protein